MVDIQWFLLVRPAYLERYKETIVEIKEEILTLINVHWDGTDLVEHGGRLLIKIKLSNQ